MSHSSRASNLAQYREALAQTNSEFFLLLAERRTLSLKIQELKTGYGRYAHYDPERELLIFTQMRASLTELSLKELLAFSLIMEDQAMALAPGSYPSWSQGSHLTELSKEIWSMINPLLLKISHHELFTRLHLTSEFIFLKEF